MADLTVFYRKPWFVLLVFLEGHRWVRSGNGGERMTHTITHFFPSRANLAGFFVESDWGFAGLVGFLPNEGEVLLGTVEEARKAGFLCVISLFSTLRRPFVTSEPRLRSANTAATPPSEPGAGAGGRPGAGGGGGGGGGGASPAASMAALYSLSGIPLEVASG